MPSIFSNDLVISKDPNDPNRTRITMLSHANPGGGLPQWVRHTVRCVNLWCSLRFAFSQEKCTSITFSTCQLRTNLLKAMNTAVNAAVQIEPFKFFHKINESVCDYREPLQYSNSQFLNAGGLEGRSTQPAGIAHLGESLLVVVLFVCLIVPRIESLNLFFCCAE